MSGAVTSVAAHPHVWATVRSEIVFGPDEKITGIGHAWTFDEFYTTMAVEGLDTDKDGAYSKEELAPLAKVNIESLKEFDYFTFVRRGAEEKPLPLKEPVDYWAEYDKTQLTLHFTLPLETPLDAKAQEIAVNVYDPSFFVAFGFAADAPVKMAGSPAPSCAAEVEKPDPESEAEAKTLSEAFFSQLGPGLEFRVAVRPDDDRQMLGFLPLERAGAGLVAAMALAGLCLLLSVAAAQADPRPISPMRLAQGAPAPPSAFGPPAATPLQTSGPLGRASAWVFE